MRYIEERSVDPKFYYIYDMHDPARTRAVVTVHIDLLDTVMTTLNAAKPRRWFDIKFAT